MNIGKCVFVAMVIALTHFMSGCATETQQDRVYHTLLIEVDKSTKEALNIRYSYGDELIDRHVPIRDWIVGPFVNHTAPMRIPQNFNISWETLDGSKHQAIVPVFSKLPGSVKNKAILFVMMPDHIQGVVVVSTASGSKRTRFY